MFHVQPMAGRFDAEHLHFGIIQERMEQPDRIASAADRRDQQVRQAAGALQHLFAGFLADHGLKITDQLGVGVRACGGAAFSKHLGLERSFRDARAAIVMAPTTLVLQGDEAEGNWLILDGNVRCEVLSPEGRSTVVATHPPGDLIGTFGRNPKTMSASLTTHGATRLLTVATAQIEQLSHQDSDFALAIARAEGYVCHALSVAYGQRHSAELDASVDRLIAAADADRDGGVTLDEAKSYRLAKLRKPATPNGEQAN